MQTSALSFSGFSASRLLRSCHYLVIILLLTLHLGHGELVMRIVVVQAKFVETGTRALPSQYSLTDLVLTGFAPHSESDCTRWAMVSEESTQRKGKLSETDENKREQTA
jgi:hypothetical protein